jgi:hypothetical protein
MAYATVTDLTTRYSAVVAGVAPATLQAAITDALAGVDDRYLADRTVRAQCLLALHYLQRDGAIAGGEDGPVTARSMGELSISYAGPAEVGSHSSTRWGRMFDELMAGVLHPLEVG